MSKIYDLAIVGGGPGGIASAVESQMLGIKDVILLEKGDNHSTTIRKYYKDKKRVDKDWKGQKIDINGHIYFMDGTKESTLDLFDEILKSHTIESRFNTEIESVMPNEESFDIHTSGNETIKARYVVIAIGKMGKPNKPSYPLPISISQLINFNANDAKPGEKILVVGGGNSAVEYACSLCAMDDITLNYRKSEFTRINEVNAENLKTVLDAKKINAKFGIDILSVEDEAKKPKVNFTDNTSETYDRIIYAIGGASPVDFLKKCNLKLDADNVPIVSEVHESSVKNMFIAGDILFKSGGSIALALNHGYDLVKEIHRRMNAKS